MKTSAMPAAFRCCGRSRSSSRRWSPRDRGSPHVFPSRAGTGDTCQQQLSNERRNAIMNKSPEAHNGSMTSWTDVPTRRLSAGGVEFAYRQLGPDTGVPVVFLTHLAAVLDNWDPRVVDGIAAQHPVITFDNRGVGASTGSTPATIQEMARDAGTFIRALGFDQVDLFGFSMGGMIAQVIAQQEPQLVRKMILAGTGPAGGPGHRQGDPHHLPRHRART